MSTICMKFDLGIHIGMHLVLFIKTRCESLHGTIWKASKLHVVTKGLFGVPHQTVQPSPRAGIGSLVACTYFRARLSACKSLPAARLPSYAQIDLLCRAWLAGCSYFSPNDNISV
jgi:hypothetical protein